MEILCTKTDPQWPEGALFSKVPEGCFMFAVFAFKIKVSIVLNMKLSINEAKLTGL